MQQQKTISQLDCDVQWKVHFIQQLVMTLSMTGPKRSSKALPKAKFTSQKWSWSLLVVCCPSDPLKLSESQRNRYIWEVCSASQWVTLKTTMPAASIGQLKGPNASSPASSTTHRTTNTSKVEWIELCIFAIFTWPLANRLPLLQTSWQLFAGKMLPQPAGGRKCFPKVCWILKHRFYLFFIFIFYFLYCSGSCHTLKWNSHGFTYVPHPDPPSHLPLHPIPLAQIFMLQK